MKDLVIVLIMIVATVLFMYLFILSINYHEHKKESKISGKKYGYVKFDRFMKEFTANNMILNEYGNISNSDYGRCSGFTIKFDDKLMVMKNIVEYSRYLMFIRKFKKYKGYANKMDW